MFAPSILFLFVHVCGVQNGRFRFLLLNPSKVHGSRLGNLFEQAQERVSRMLTKTLPILFCHVLW